MDKEQEGQGDAKPLSLKERMAMLKANSVTGAIPVPMAATSAASARTLVNSTASSPGQGKADSNELNNSNTDFNPNQKNSSRSFESSEGSKDLSSKEAIALEDSINIVNLSRPIIRASSRRRPSEQKLVIPPENIISSDDINIFGKASSNESPGKKEMKDPSTPNKEPEAKAGERIENDDSWDIVKKDEAGDESPSASSANNITNIENPRIIFPFILNDSIFQETCLEEIKKRVLFEIEDDESKNSDITLMTKPSDITDSVKIESSQQLSDLVKSAAQNGQKQFLLCSKVNIYQNDVVLEISGSASMPLRNSGETSSTKADKLEEASELSKQAEVISTSDDESKDVIVPPVSASSSDAQAINKFAQESEDALTDNYKELYVANEEEKFDENGLKHVRAVCEEPERKKINVDLSSDIDNQNEYTDEAEEKSEPNVSPFVASGLQSSSLVDQGEMNDSVHLELYQQVNHFNAEPYPYSSSISSSSQDFFEKEQSNSMHASKEAEAWAEKGLSQIDQLMHKPREELQFALTHAYDSDKQIKSEEWKIADELLDLASADSQSATLMKLSQLETDEMLFNKATDASLALKNLSEILSRCPNIALFLPELLESLSAKLNKSDSPNDQPKPNTSNSDNLISANSNSVKPNQAIANSAKPNQAITNSANSNAGLYSNSANTDDYYERHNNFNQREEVSPYAEQLAVLVDQGFDDLEKNLRILKEVNGDVNEAVERLLS